jgi:hypothetical protein
LERAFDLAGHQSAAREMEPGERDMIFHRLASAIRNRDWFTVVIEFVIVVAGIFGGLQANEWAQEREDRRQEQFALERLFLESESAYQLLSMHEQRTLRLNTLRRNAVQFADSDEPVPEDELPLKIGINTLARFPSILPVSVVYDELRSVGQMQLIRSSALREQIAEFHTEVVRFNKLQEALFNGTDRFWVVYQRHVIWNYNPASETSDILLSEYNWETLRADEQFIFEIIGLLYNQLLSQEVLLSMLDRARVLCETLGEITAQTCDVENG